MPATPAPLLSAVPIIALLVTLVGVVVFEGADAISSYSPFVLLGSACMALVIAFRTRCLSRRGLAVGLRRSASQILPAVPMLLCIAVLATTWMMSGIVPALVDYGLSVLNPKWFLVTTCVSCAVVSVLTGSSWSTIATIGVAFMGIGSVMGYHHGWVAGAIISGAYFGDKVSPLSDTTVVASSTCGVDLFEHIRYLMITAVPAMSVALLVFGLRGFTGHMVPVENPADFADGLRHVFNITPWVLVIPLITGVMIALRVPTLITLVISALLGAVGIFVFQPAIGADFIRVLEAVWGGHSMATGDAAVDELVATGGITGMLPTIFLVLSALVFGGVMIGTGMLGSLASAMTARLRRRTSVVGATVASGLCVNVCTADQYLALIITGNMFRAVYRRSRLEQRLLSRSMEDSVSVTSVLIPWNSCGVTQSTVLGVSTLAYLPYCIFNYLSPLMSLVMVWTGFKVRAAVRGTLRTARG